MQDVPGVYDISVQEVSASEEALKTQLDAGSVIICAMRTGDFTVTGHFIVIYGYDEYGFKVNDPNCVARSRQSWSFDRIKYQIKKIWSHRQV